MMRYLLALALKNFVIVIISNEFFISIFHVFRLRREPRWSYYRRFIYILSRFETRRTCLLILFIIRLVLASFGLLFYTRFLVFSFMSGFLFLAAVLFRTLNVSLLLLVQSFRAWRAFLKCSGLFFLLGLSQHLIINIFLPRKPLNLLKVLFTSL